jgi:hypothetical protein
MIKEILDSDKHTSEYRKHELTIILDTILEQKYLQFNNQFYKQDVGLAVVGPTSAFCAEIFIQYLEHTK